MSAVRPTHEIVDSIRIPTLPASVERIQALLSSSDVDMTDVVGAFLNDPPLAAKVLQIANSVQYGLQEKTTSVPKAISVLGLRTLSAIALRAGIVSLYSDKESTGEFSLRDVWKHSIMTGHISEDLAKRCRNRGTDLTPQDYYTCGLLHDLGKIVLFDNLKEHYIEVIRRAQDEEDALEEEEMRLLGVRHSDAGHMAAVLWKLPAPIPELIRFHHRPGGLNGLVETAKVVSCADEISDALAKDPRADPTNLRGKVQTVPAGLREDQLLQAIATATELWKHVEV